MTDLELFHVDPVTLPPGRPVEKLSPDRRRTLRQRAAVDRGVHPLTGGRARPDLGTCGDCVHRFVVPWHDRSYPKCDLGPRTHGPGTDVRAWWPACDRFEPSPSVKEASR
jgi:hypothetical protein